MKRSTVCERSVLVELQDRRRKSIVFEMVARPSYTEKTQAYQAVSAGLLSHVSWACCCYYPCCYCCCCCNLSLWNKRVSCWRLQIAATCGLYVGIQASLESVRCCGRQHWTTTLRWSHCGRMATYEHIHANIHRCNFNRDPDGKQPSECLPVYVDTELAHSRPLDLFLSFCNLSFIRTNEQRQQHSLVNQNFGILKETFQISLCQA